MPASLHAGRRGVLTWSALGAFMLGPASRVSARTPRIEANGSSDRAPSGTAMKHAFVDNVVMLAELTVRPEKLAEFLEYTVENLKPSRSYPGNLAFDILFNEAQPTKVTFYEVWTSPKAQKDYMAWRIQAGDLTKLLSFLASEPKFTALRSIAA